MLIRRAVAGVAIVAAASVGFFTGAATANAASGTPFVYSLKATASGTLDGVAFTNALVTMEQTTNTADVQINNGQPSNRDGTVTVTVAGVGVGVGQDTLTYGTSCVNQGTTAQGGSSFGFNGSTSFRFAVKNSTFSNYNMDRPSGPAGGPSYRFHCGAPPAEAVSTWPASGPRRSRPTYPSSTGAVKRPGPWTDIGVLVRGCVERVRQFLRVIILGRNGQSRRIVRVNGRRAARPSDRE